MPSAHSSLAQWLDYIENTHHKNIDMGLTRSRKVFVDLGVDFSQSCVVTVAGTNGKGTTCRFIEQACLAAGLRVGVYASPHIESFNERIRINGDDVGEADICAAFTTIHSTKADTSLTYFEYATLAAFYLFAQQPLDVVIIEVGLGGRLDATNIVDANIGIITSIGLDHQAYLGNTTELIAAEKAGIVKPHQRVVIGYAPVHESIKDIVEFQKVEVLFKGEHFSDNSIYLSEADTVSFDISEAKIPQQNVMTAIAGLRCIAKHLGADEPLLVKQSSLQSLIQTVNMPGRLQVLSDAPSIVLDVAHNEAAAKLLVHNLQLKDFNKCHIVIGMLKDKNIESTINELLALKPATWHCIDLPSDRGEKAQRFADYLQSQGHSSHCYQTFAPALQAAKAAALKNDLILVVGSFVLASQCMHLLQST